MLKQTLLLLTTSTILLAQSTMCYKENHTTPSTIESIKLDGGECKTSKSVQDMKNDGWTISNISMNAGDSGINYMYVFSKGSNSSMTMNRISKEDIKAEIRKLAKEEEIELEKARQKDEENKAAFIYQSTCSKCHGQNGEIPAYGKGVALNTLSVTQLITRIEAYAYGDKMYGLEMIMKPYSDSLQPEEVKAIANYIQTLK